MKFAIQSLAELPPQDAASCIASLVEAFVAVNTLYLKRNLDCTTIYKSGVKYKADEPWRDVPALLTSLQGDCKSLVAWRIAELRLLGHMALVHVVYTPEMKTDLFHVQVRRRDKVEDPSRFLGMRT